ncbi:MAG: hypothetical protein AAGF12_11470 [Myxococcota bacterium]
MALIETEEAARRLARAIASDLSLYNEEKIVEGVTKDSLFDVLSDEIEEGRALFKSRVAPDLYAKNFYDRAIIDILVRSKGHVKSVMW